MFRRLTLLTLVLASCSQSPGDWYPPDPPSGKADGFDFLAGSSIPSQFVDTSRRYLRQRRIGVLSDVGLDADHLALANRVDGVMANSPADGYLHVAELVKMEQPGVFDSLFPSEQAMLADLWKLMLVPTQEIHVMPSALDNTVTEKLPGPVTLPVNFQITELGQLNHSIDGLARRSRVGACRYLGPVHAARSLVVLVGAPADRRQAEQDPGGNRDARGAPARDDQHHGRPVQLDGGDGAAQRLALRHGDVVRVPG